MLFVPVQYDFYNRYRQARLFKVEPSTTAAYLYNEDPGMFHVLGRLLRTIALPVLPRSGYWPE